MKLVISTPRFVLVFGYVLVLAHASAAEMPGGLKIPHRQRHRVAGTNQHGPSRPAKGADTPDDEFSKNWAGAFQANIPGGTGTFNAITATWQIPGFSDPPNPGAPYDLTWQVDAFIGIDGTKSCNSVFKAGITTNAIIDDNGNFLTDVVPFVWWFPANKVDLPLYMDLAHTVQVTLTTLSLSQGTAEFINFSTGDRTSVSLTAPDPNHYLCGLTADWIVENPKLKNGDLAPLLPFAPYNFEGCVARTTSGLSTNLIDATRVYMIDDNTGAGRAFPTIVGANSLRVTYGPAP